MSKVVREDGQNRPLVSFVIAVHNGARRLQRCFDSIYRQSFGAWEIVVVDGGSMDGTKDILINNSGQIEFWVSEPDRGIYDAWNKALKHCTGEWIHFLGADDYLWDERVLERIAPMLSDRSNSTRILYGKVNVVDAHDRVIQTEGCPWEFIRTRFLQVMAIPHQGVFHHCSLFEKRQFDVNFQYAGDYDFLLPVVHSAPPRFVDQVIAAWTHGGATSSPHRALAVLREMQQAKVKNHITSRFPLWLFTKAWLKIVLWKLFGDAVLHGAVDIYRVMTLRSRCHRSFTK